MDCIGGSPLCTGLTLERVWMCASRAVLNGVARRIAAFLVPHLPVRCSIYGARIPVAGKRQLTPEMTAFRLMDSYTPGVKSNLPEQLRCQRFPAFRRHVVDSFSNTRQLTLYAMIACAALLAPALAQAQEAGAAGGALSGAFFNGSSVSIKAARNVLDSARVDNLTLPQPDSSGKSKAPPPRVMPFIDGGYGRRRPAVGLDFSFELGQTRNSQPASSPV
ncbi:hypothetical protein [Paraburkholderia sacchari]|uniref:Uncharacterized protein n=1 Tax=Paraburkholderia sacchari TaxID=159450 RepID=A0A8T6ZJS6_9BURK|nr:hypothetical protein [Paraburkholderia sacchari]NLP64915.1 hypothetical protein [Paraburkholderia sacchari]